MGKAKSKKQKLEIIQRKSGRSALDQAGHLCGIFQGAPPDLATSRDYLKQYARPVK